MRLRPAETANLYIGAVDPAPPEHVKISAGAVEHDVLMPPAGHACEDLRRPEDDRLRKTGGGARGAQLLEEVLEARLRLLPALRHVRVIVGERNDQRAARRREVGAEHQLKLLRAVDLIHAPLSGGAGAVLGGALPLGIARTTSVINGGELDAAGVDIL